MTLAFLIVGPALAFSGAFPALAQDSVLPPSSQSRQHYVPQHFAPNGEYVPPHFETPKAPPFRGHFAAREAKRHRDAQHGYKEATPNYDSGPAPDEKRMEGR